MICTLALMVCAGTAQARNAYVANAGNGSVTVFDVARGAVVGGIALGGKPVDVAITPDGGRAYVVDEARNAVLGIDTGTNGVFATIPVGKEPRGIAISPNGQAAYVTNFGDGTLSAISVAGNVVSGGPIPVGAEPEGLAVSPDGRFAYIARRSGGVAVLNLAAPSAVTVVPDADGPSRVAVGPGGGRVFVANADAPTVTAFNPANGAVIGAPMTLFAPAADVAVAPSGAYAYASSPKANAVTAIDAARPAPVGVIGGLPGAGALAIEPSGNGVFAAASNGALVARFATVNGAVTGSIQTGPEPSGLAIVPNQGPRASFWVSPQRRLAKRKLTFHAGASGDADGKIVTYQWVWGDGNHVKSETGVKGHRYRKPGTYTATLTVIDDEGCSNRFVFTGQTASCNGSPLASTSQTVVVTDPRGSGLRLAGGRRQRVRGAVMVFAKCPVAECALRARGRIVAKFRRHGRARRYKLHIGPELGEAQQRSWRRLPIELPRGRRRAVIRALLNGGRARAKLTVIARDAHGVSKLRRRNVKLVFKRRRN